MTRPATRRQAGAMNTLAQTAIEKDPLAAHAATEALLSALARCPALARAEVEEILRLVPGRRAIFRARLDGRGIILRHLVHADERAADDRPRP